MPFIIVQQAVFAQLKPMCFTILTGVFHKAKRVNGQVRIEVAFGKMYNMYKIRSIYDS